MNVTMKLIYGNIAVEFDTDTPWTPERPRVMATRLAHELPKHMQDLCRQLVEKYKKANERAGAQIAASPRGCGHMSWTRNDAGRPICIDCGAYLD